MLWLQVFGLGILLLAWLAWLKAVLTQAGQPPEFVLDEKQPLDPFPEKLSLSVVIPARNEVHNIERCVRAALAVTWRGPLQVVVLNDRSTDGTGEKLAALAKDEPRLKVVEGRDPPPGWLGKPHALHLAAAHADGDFLLFVDADVTLDPLGPARLVGRALAQGAQLASALGRLQVESFWERVIQTRLGALIAGGNPLSEVNDPTHERALANGQCLLFSREGYARIGGHEAIRGSVLDDVDFAKRAKALSLPYRLYYGPGVFSCRMYTTLGEIWNGWSKNLFPALGYRYSAVLGVTALLFVFSVLPFLLLLKNLALLALGAEVSPLLLGLEAAICAVALLTDALGHRANGYRAGLFWTFPLGLLLVVLIFWNSAWRIGSGRGVAWKGRTVEARRSKDPPEL